MIDTPEYPSAYVNSEQAEKINLGFLKEPS